eukprot:6963019-Pyramimonas_sp.AAC.1
MCIRDSAHPHPHAHARTLFGVAATRASARCRQLGERQSRTRGVGTRDPHTGDYQVTIGKAARWGEWESERVGDSGGVHCKNQGLRSVKVQRHSEGGAEHATKEGHHAHCPTKADGGTKQAPMGGRTVVEQPRADSTVAAEME